MVLQQAHSSFRARKDTDKLEASRIVATTGALALNVVILLLLLAPAARLVMPQIVKTTISWSPMEDKKPIPPPLPPPPLEDPVPIQRTRPEPIHTAPVVPASDIATVTEQIVQPEGTLPADPQQMVADATTQPSIAPPAGPMIGVHLEYLKAAPPPYPREGILARLEGTVMLQILVGVDGKPIEVTIQRSSGQRVLDEAARRFVLRHWTFRPAMRDGQPVQAIGIVPIDFKLD